MEVGQSEADGQYQITCSSTSDCTPAPITLLGSLGNKVVPLYGVNFTCIIKYNDYDGWSVSCTGSIPKSVVSSIDEITCRPILEDKKEADKTEAKVSKDVLLCNNDESTYSLSFWFTNRAKCIELTTIIIKGDGFCSITNANNAFKID